MKRMVRRLSWFLGVLGLIGILLQTLQVQVEHTHSNGRSQHTHSHGHSHSHSHGHSHHHHGHDHAHHHDSGTTEMSQSPQKHIHVTLLWWEFTLNGDTNNQRPVQTPVEAAEPIHSHVRDKTLARDSAPALDSSHKNHGPLIASPHWTQLISEWVSSWQSVLPPPKKRLPIQQRYTWTVTSATSCYQSVSEPPPVPPPETALSVSFT